MAGIDTNLTSAIAEKINMSDLLMNIPGMDLLIKILQAASVVFLIYLVFLIIKSITGIKSASRLKRIANSVESIDKKMDALIGKKKKK